MFSIGKQSYREVINFVSYIHVVYSYNDIYYTNLYVYKLSSSFRCNIIDIQWNKPVGGGGGATPNRIG